MKLDEQKLQCTGQILEGQIHIGQILTDLAKFRQKEKPCFGGKACVAMALGHE
jgi:hypothetical protein